jgi:outer membrane protein assembly factor BamE (lipoprotein component of BamABCDE complex)
MSFEHPRIAVYRSLALALLLAALASGCVYRPNIQQGNLLTVTDVDQVTVGMTRSQVRYLLGTPMVSDPFAPQRWDYVYRMQYGRDKNVDTAHFVVRFDGDKVTAVEKLDLPEPPRTAKGQRSGKSNDKSSEVESGREPPPAPSIEQPQPDTRRPTS